MATTEHNQIGPVNVSTMPLPERRRLAPWHIAALIAGVPLVLFLSGVGANAIADHFVSTSAATPAATVTHHKARPAAKPTPTAPQYNLAGYQAAISGTEEQALVTALNRFRSDIRQLQFQTVATDSLTLTGAANTWLATLRHTTPPPANQGQKLTYMMAAILARRAATTTQGAISSANLASLQRGLALANQARAALARAIASAPQATAPQGS